MTIPAFPLQWPAGWKRTGARYRTRAKFGKQRTVQSSFTSSDGSRHSWKQKGEVTIADGVNRVREQLQRMGILDDDLVVSSNLQLRLDGFPRSGQAEPNDPGVAVYWHEPNQYGNPPRCMAIDRYDRVADNLAAVAATLDAMRAIERHGGAEILERAFTGFTALPGPGMSGHWSDVLDPADPAGSYRRLRGEHHPDRGGDASEFQRVQMAWEQHQQETGAS